MTAPAGAALAGRRAVVTGASRGIGLEIARALAGAGAEVALVARSADRLADEVARLGGRAFAEPCDVADAEEVTRVAARIGERWRDGADLLVSNAGVFSLAAVHLTAPDDFRRTLDTNLV